MCVIPPPDWETWGQERVETWGNPLQPSLLVDENIDDAQYCKILGPVCKKKRYVGHPAVIPIR